MTSFVIVLTTFPADGDVEAFAARLVSDRLAACVNVLPAMKSIYRWKDVVEQADERQLMIKTTVACVAALEELVSNIHPYEVPEFVVVPIQSGSAPYLAWLSQNAGPQDLETLRP